MRARRFGESLLFALLAALGAVPWTLAIGVAVGRGRAEALYWLALAVLHLVWIAPGWPCKLRTSLLAAMAAVVFAFLSAPAGVTAAILVAVGRSGFLYRAKPARAVVTEALFVGGGLAFAGWLAGPALLDQAFSVWGFYLLQSVFFLLGGVAERREEAQTDPFDDALRRATAVLEG